MMFAAPLLLAAAMANSAVQSDPDPNELCYDLRTTSTVIQLVKTWSQEFAFARVIIGPAADTAGIRQAKLITQDDRGITCHAIYDVERPEVGGTYRVNIPDLRYRIQSHEGGYTVTLVNLPVPDGTPEQLHEVEALFTIDDRPYPEVLKENAGRIAQQRGNKSESPAHVPTVTADQMARSWVDAVTGGKRVSPLYLINGPGDPGDNCNVGGGKHLLQFGAKLGGKAGLPLSDYFSGNFVDEGWAVVGAYWYDSDDQQLATVRLLGFQLHGRERRKLPDDRFKIDFIAPGRVTLNGVHFHQCTLAKTSLR